MAEAYELINRMNRTDRNAVVMSYKREIRKIIQQFGYTLGYDSYEGKWKIYC